MLKMTQTIHLFDNRRYPVNENADREQINSMAHNNTTTTTNVISVLRSVWTGNKDYWFYIILDLNTCAHEYKEYAVWVVCEKCRLQTGDYKLRVQQLPKLASKANQLSKPERKEKLTS